MARERPATPVFIARHVNSQGRAEFSGAATCRFPGWNRVGRFATDFASKTLLRDGNQPISNEVLDNLVSDIVSELRNNMTTVVASNDLGDMVLKRLLKLDTVAYVRFASVYKDFQDIESFYNELTQIQNLKDS